jgi:hypothetical protein
MTRPIGISDDQLAMIMAACAPILPQDRDRFLRSLADALRGEPQLGDGQLYRAIAQLRGQYWRPPALDEQPRSRRVVGAPIA